MAGNTRGKIKEHLEGCHRNADWTNHHIDTVLVLIKDRKPNLTKALKAYQTAIQVLDEQLIELYAKI